MSLGELDYLIVSADAIHFYRSCKKLRVFVDVSAFFIFWENRTFVLLPHPIALFLSGNYQ